MPNTPTPNNPAPNNDAENSTALVEAYRILLDRRAGLLIDVTPFLASPHNARITVDGIIAGCMTHLQEIAFNPDLQAHHMELMNFGHGAFSEYAVRLANEIPQHFSEVPREKPTP